MDGRHADFPWAMNCGIGEPKGRAYGTERSPSVSLCQKSIGNVRVIKHRMINSLEVNILEFTTFLEREERNVNDVEARLNSGTASSPIVAWSISPWVCGRRKAQHSCARRLVNRAPIPTHRPVVVNRNRGLCMTWVSFANI
jgi:hypothetical protein